MQRSLVLLLCFVSFVVQAQRHYDVLHYSYELELSDSTNSIKGKAILRFRALDTLSALDLDFDEARQGRGMQVSGIYMGRANATRLSFSLSKEKLSVRFHERINRGEEQLLTILYQGVPSDGLIISKNKYGDRSFFADNWPNRAHFWIPCKDVPDDKASFEFKVTAPSKYRVVSNGIKVEEKINGAKTTTHWKEDVPLPTKVMAIGVAKFAVKEFPDNPPGIPVSAWVFQQDSTKGFHDYASAPAILKFFSDYIAPYPYKKLANVQSKTIFGGMENAGAIFYAENSVSGKREVDALLSHEIAHQWFGDMATEKSFTHLWLSEGFATYLTNIYWQHKYGDEAFKKRLQKERDEVAGFVKRSNQPVVDSLSSYMDLLNANSYQKGGWVLHMLRHELGDSVFHKIIQTYYQQYKGSNADTRDFESVVEKVSGRELTWFFDQWLYQPGIPKLQVSWKAEGTKIKAEIKQTGNRIFNFPLEVGLIAADGTMTIQKMLVSSKEAELKLETSAPPVKLVLDPHTNLLFEGSVSQAK